MKNCSLKFPNGINFYFYGIFIRDILNKLCPHVGVRGKTNFECARKYRKKWLSIENQLHRSTMLNYLQVEKKDQFTNGQDFHFSVA